jgi:alpha-tubulin suppressor-like RCC1 family protein
MVAAGSVHSLALTDKHNVYSCGYNQKGQLGLGD